MPQLTMRLRSSDKNTDHSDLSHEGILGRRDSNEAFPASEMSGREGPNPAKKSRTTTELVGIITDTPIEDDMVVEDDCRDAPPFDPSQAPSPPAPTPGSPPPSSPSVSRRRRATASPAQTADAAKFMETLTYEMKTKTSRKGQKSFGYNEELFAAVLDAQEAGWENISRLQDDPSKLLKFKTPVMEGTTLRERAANLDLPELFEGIFSSVLELMLWDINAEVTKRATAIVDDGRNSKAARSRLREFTVEEHRQCFAFNIVYMALTPRAGYDAAWKWFCQNHLDNRKDDSGKPRETNIGKNRAKTWRSCLAGVKLDSLIETLQSTVLDMVLVGTLMAIDESLFAASALLYRFWENAIQSIDRKPHSLGHLVYMGVLLLDLSHLPLAAFFVPFTNEHRVSPSDAFLDIIRRRYKARPEAHIHAIGDAAFSTAVVFDDIHDGVSTERRVVDGTFSISGIGDKLKLAMTYGLSKNHFRVFYNRNTGLSMLAIHATDKAGKGHFVFRMSTAFSPDGKDIEPSPHNESRYSPKATNAFLSLGLPDLKRLAEDLSLDSSGSAHALVGRICGISVPEWLREHGGASPTTDDDKLVLVDADGVATTFSIADLKSKNPSSPWKNPVLRYLFEKYGLGPHGNRNKGAMVDRMVYIAKKKADDPALTIEGFCGPTRRYEKGSPKETQMPFSALLYKAFFNLQDRLNHFYTGIRIWTKYMDDNAQRVGEMLVVGLVDTYSLYVENSLPKDKVLTREKVVNMRKSLDKEYPIGDMMEDVLALLLK